MKKSLTIITAAALLISIPSLTKAADSIPVFINGAPVSFEVQPMIENGSTLVPFRPVFEALGLSVTWNKDTQTVKGTRGTAAVELQIGSKSVKVNEKTEELSVAPKIVNGNTLVPLRFIGEVTGKKVVWDETYHTVLLRDSLTAYFMNMINNNSKLTYTGEMKDGKRSGYGKLFSDGKLVFEGEFKDSKMEGQGILYWQGGQKYYEGQWSNGFMNGLGKLYTERGTLWYDQITMVSNKIQGTGTLYYLNGDYYKGDLVDGNATGQGQYVTEKGTLVYEGQFKNGVYEGLGKTFYANGGVRLEGDFHNNRLDGQGKFYNTTGSVIYEGSYKGGVRDGEGTLYNLNGTIYFKGMFKDGKSVPE
ncbi:copper amine oxidase N-terminal domain-containing protein [Paenibacillus cremeus]|uniref:Copper amine oxidase-like N-terminal domain-containing protein n=1 Tax=Paenibacillus cremeus TaxID=2163881 RepID=A0A559K088_9BACL|nr:copper amine oxidase N-terminal domain-containing protein [Paenibacillus cremeus]TVY05543.1 hypothetical protein FPZ49_29610 [Paenibacillus cremeus]